MKLVFYLVLPLRPVTQQRQVVRIHQKNFGMSAVHAEGFISSAAHFRDKKRQFVCFCLKEFSCLKDSRP